MARATVAGPDLYERDFVAWAKAQAEALRARRFDALDLERLAEEVEDLGRAERNAARSQLARIIEHLLKLEHSPAVAPRRIWRDTVRDARADLERVSSGTVRQELAAELADHYRHARRQADVSLRDFGEDAAADALPAECPWDLDALLGDWLPERR